MSTNRNKKVFNDPIHGPIKLHPLLVRFIDTPQFQRLRYIKQMGAVYFVYPGASHNRFEHSIGVAHLAGELVRTLKREQKDLGITKRDELCVEIAGLCHDLGHGPFSHMFDEMFIKKKRPELKWKHEKASVEMFKHMVKVNNLKVDMQRYNLRLPEDLVFIIEQINGPLEPNEYQGLVDELTRSLGLDAESTRSQEEDDESTGSQEEDEESTGSEDEDAELTKSQDQAAKSIEDEDEDAELTASEDEDEDAEAQAAWPYKGRPESMSFLYDIVANKRNGVDVDKWDYFARDCLHLGISNDFDYERFLRFARVCEVKRRKQICTRDKEVYNLYDMFHTRYSIHSKACHHKVVHIIHTMIAEAFRLADNHIKIPGSNDHMFTLSTAIDDMEAYTKLTDQVFQQILYSRRRNLANARKILKKIENRKHYRLVFEKRRPPSTVTKGEIPWWFSTQVRNDVRLTKEDYFIDEIKINYGKKKKNPINRMRFYRKDDPDRAIPITRDQVSAIRPKRFSETLVRVYSKKTDEESLRRAKSYFREYNPNN